MFPEIVSMTGIPTHSYGTAWGASQHALQPYSHLLLLLSPLNPTPAEMSGPRLFSKHPKATSSPVAPAFPQRTPRRTPSPELCGLLSLVPIKNGIILPYPLGSSLSQGTSPFQVMAPDILISSHSSLPQDIFQILPPALSSPPPGQASLPLCPGD